MRVKILSVRNPHFAGETPNRKRPDLVILANSTISAVATEDFDDNEQLTKMKKILLIELKRGGHKIGRDEINQANGYIEDLLNCGVIDGSPFIYSLLTILSVLSLNI